MADVVNQIIGAIPADADPAVVQTILAVCSVSVPLFAVVFIDLIRDIFSGFFRG